MPEAPRSTSGRDWLGRLSPAINIAVVLALLSAVYLLPPDTSLSQIERSGILRACVPNAYPPLVTGNAEAPGLEIELLQELADELGVRLVLNTNSTMGRDFNPRNWRLTRAQCQIIAGGVLATPTTRSYIDTTPPHLEIGWAIIDPNGDKKSLNGANVGFFAGFSGFDRIALSQYLRGAGAEISIVASREAFAQGLSNGSFAFGITESLAARQIAGENGWTVQWLSDSLGRIPVAFGLWKGDLTLLRRIVSILDEMTTDGTYARLLAKYELDQPIEGVFDGGPQAAAPEGPRSR